jgi:hypothetical protein
MDDTTTTARPITDWTPVLLDQLTWHWEHQLRPRLDGLTDDEYLWEPVPGCWSLRPRGASRAPVQAGAGGLVAEFALPEPDPPPVTTIAWRLGHVLVGILGMRNAAHFGGEPVGYDTARWPETATEALAGLDAAYDHWTAGVRALDAEALARPVGEAEGDFADHPMAALVLHISREVIHHGAEIALLRDLYRATAGAALR